AHRDRRGARDRRRDQLRDRRRSRLLRSLARSRRAHGPPHQLAHARGGEARARQGILVRLPHAIEHSLPRKVTLLVLATTLLALLLSATGLVVYDLRLYETQRSGDFLSQAEVLARATAPALSFNDQRSAEKDLSVLQVR